MEMDEKQSSVHSLKETETSNPSNDQKKQRGSIISIALQIIKDLKPGVDVSHYKVPPQLHMPKSSLQFFSEPIYCYSHDHDLLSRCVRGPGTSSDRFLRVVAWHLSTIRLGPFCQAPLNPILGETHHVSSGSLNVIAEQISHHPPMSALYATNVECGIRLRMWGTIKSHYRGNRVETTFPGDKTLWLDHHEERYDMTLPAHTTRLFPWPGNEWTGSSTVKCRSSGLQAEINFKSNSLLAGMRGSSGGRGQVSGHIMDTSNGVVLYELSGHWNSLVMVKDTKTRETRVLYDAISALANVKPPTLLEHEKVETLATSESVVVWKEVMQALVMRDWTRVKAVKHEIEEKQRVLENIRRKEGKQWVPKYFVEGVGSDGWHWWGGQGKHVPQSPLVVHHY